MQPNSTLLLRCPECYKHVKFNRDIFNYSENSEVFSDLKNYLRMLSDSRLAKCPYCKNCFWTEYVDCHLYQDFEGEVNLQLNHQYELKFCEVPDMTDYLIFLNIGWFKDKSHKIYIRMKILHLFNDRIRDQLQPYNPPKKHLQKFSVPAFGINNPQNPILIQNEQEQEIWVENIKTIAEEIEVKSVQDFFLLVEVNRYIGRFAIAKKILEGKCFTKLNKFDRSIHINMEKAIKNKYQYVFKI